MPPATDLILHRRQSARQLAAAAQDARAASRG
jgi:hypothetical protein